jgi:hypothetical protein
MEGGKKKASAWIKHVKAYAKQHGIKFGDALSKAGASFKHSGGQLTGKGIAGGKRRTRKHRGGQLYGETGGTYTGSELADGMGAFPKYDLSSMQWPGANPSRMTAGRRSRRGKRHSRRR